MNPRKWGIPVAFVLLASFFGNFTTVTLVKAQDCSTISDLYQKQSCLVTQGNQIKQDINSNKQNANNIQDALSSLTSNISSLQNQVNNTNDQIATTQGIISDLNNHINQTQSQLDDLNKKLSSAYDSLYEMSQTSTVSLLFQSQSVNDLLSQSQYIEAVQSNLLNEISQANTLKNNLQTQKQQSEQQQANLQSLSQQLNGSKNNLVIQQNEQQGLLSATNDQIASDLSTYNSVQQKLAAVSKQIAALSATSNWGTGIVSSYNPAWYYSQFNYPGVTLGNSPYSLYDYGCLVTSYAMVTSYYGHHVTPPQIADTNSNFDNQGDLMVQPPAPTGLISSYNQPVNWSTVNSQLDSGHPVIVSVYLPSVGAINSDGSSHFIVLWGRSGTTYLMQDPIASSGRSYSLSQVRSMKIVTP